jgi:hypothetical protein
MDTTFGLIIAIGFLIALVGVLMLFGKFSVKPE